MTFNMIVAWFLVTIIVGGMALLAYTEITKEFETPIMTKSELEAGGRKWHVPCVERCTAQVSRTSN